MQIASNDKWSSEIITRIYNVLGENVVKMNKNKSLNEKNIFMELSDLVNGFYFLMAEDGNHFAEKTLIISK